MFCSDVTKKISMYTKMGILDQMKAAACARGPIQLKINYHDPVSSASEQSGIYAGCSCIGE